MASLSVPGFTLTTLSIMLILHLSRCQEAPTACGPTNCLPPDCFCAGNTIPGGLTRENTPQMVLFTFDDAVNGQVFGPLMDLFGMDKNRNNPNGCPIGMTLFVSHEFTDYCKVAEFYKNGHEVASHSITHKSPSTYWRDIPYAEYDLEADGQKAMLKSMGGIPEDKIIGYRSPFIQPGGDTQFRVLKHRKFTYDSTLLVSTFLPQNRVWPYTLDFPHQVACGIPPCPQEGYPGLWELPIQPIPDHTGELCTFLDRCENSSSTAEEVYGYLIQSFNESYNGNRAPLIINMHAYWFEENDHSLQGFHRFIDEIVTMNDTYIITSTQLVEWMRQPTSINQLPASDLWKCNEARPTKPCSNKRMRDRAKKPDFEAYTSKLKAIYEADYAPEDGGKSVLAVTAVLFGVCFVYLLYNEPI